MKILVTSDLHLGERIWKHRPLSGDSYYAWHQIVKIAIKQDVDLVILAGDILDKQMNTSGPVSYLIRGLHMLYDKGIPVWFTQGQHEMQSDPWAAISDTAEHINEQAHELEGVTFVGRDFCDAEKLTEFCSGELARSADVLVMHQVWLEFMGEECKPQGSFELIPANVKLLITGDYHENICQDYNVNGRKLTVLSPGSTHLRSIAEPPDKYVFIVEFEEGKEKPKISTHPLLSRQVLNITADDFEKLPKKIQAFLDEVEAYVADNNIPDSVAMPLVRITYNKDDSEAISKVEQKFAKKAHLFFKVVKTHNPEDAEPQLLHYMDSEDRVSMLGALDNYVDKAKQPEVYSLAAKMLSSDEPTMSLMSWLKEQTNEIEQG